jgi:hypothetical protein
VRATATSRQMESAVPSSAPSGSDFCAPSSICGIPSRGECVNPVLSYLPWPRSTESMSPHCAGVARLRWTCTHWRSGSTPWRSRARARSTLYRGCRCGPPFRRSGIGCRSRRSLSGAPSAPPSVRSRASTDGAGCPSSLPSWLLPVARAKGINEHTPFSALGIASWSSVGDDRLPLRLRSSFAGSLRCA